MAIITLSNQHPDPHYPQASINILTGQCKLGETVIVGRPQLLEMGFHHPLLKPEKMPTDRLFHYEYNNIDEFLQAARYVYSILLNAENPAACRFKINPSRLFKIAKEESRVYFSIKPNQAAEDFISLNQLEQIVSDLSGYPFHYLDGILIDQEFSLTELPKSIKGDLLFNADQKWINLLKSPTSLEGFELRYINSSMRFGVFARNPIKKGEVTFFYGGIKKIQDDEDVNYAFVQKLDCLNMYIDARNQGNLARFINHAPNSNNKDDRPPKRLQEANMVTASRYVNGIEIIVFSAIRDIEEGEQLLVDYGKNFFKSSPMNRFKANGKVTSSPAFEFNSRKKLHQLRVMANYGVEKAQHYLVVRLCLIALIIAIGAIVLNVLT